MIRFRCKWFQSNILLHCFYCLVFLAMIDSLGGLVRVNNFLASLNVKPISNKNLKTMERRAGNIVEHVADMSTREAAKDAFHQEMK